MLLPHPPKEPCFLSVGAFLAAPHLCRSTPARVRRAQRTSAALLSGILPSPGSRDCAVLLVRWSSSLSRARACPSLDLMLRVPEGSPSRSSPHLCAPQMCSSFVQSVGCTLTYSQSPLSGVIPGASPGRAGCSSPSVASPLCHCLWSTGVWAWVNRFPRATGLPRGQGIVVPLAPGLAPHSHAGAVSPRTLTFSSLLSREAVQVHGV